MQIQAPFYCFINIDRFGEKYRGLLKIKFPEQKNKPKLFWFILHYPHTRDSTEIAFYTDHGMTSPFAEGVGTNLESGVYIDIAKFNLRFSFDLPDDKIGVFYTLIVMLMTCINMLEQSFEKLDDEDCSKIKVGINCIWFQECENLTDEPVRSVIKYLS